MIIVQPKLKCVLKIQSSKHVYENQTGLTSKAGNLGYSVDNKTTRHIITLTCKSMPDCVGTGPITM